MAAQNGMTHLGRWKQMCGSVGKLQEMRLRLCRIGLQSPTLFQGDWTSSEKIGSHWEGFYIRKLYN